MAGPNTHREALIAELLGDVGALLDRAEALNASLPAAVDQAAAKVRAAGETAAGSVKGAGEAFVTSLDAQTKETLKGVQKAAREAQSAAKVVERSAWRFALLTALIGLAAGILGGGLAALAVSHGLLGM
jgi:ElaB/YqjD/DUF883 family membrane-anchored ribosome-binding protein